MAKYSKNDYIEVFSMNNNGIETLLSPLNI